MQKQVLQTICDVTGAVKQDGETGWVRIPGTAFDVCPDKASLTLAELVQAIADKRKADEDARRAELAAQNQKRIDAQKAAQDAAKTARESAQAK